MKAGDLVLLLNPILSLISTDAQTVHILHKSLIHYLLDFTRSGHLPFDLAHSVAAIRLLKHATGVRCVPFNRSTPQSNSQRIKIIASIRISMIHTYSLWRSHTPSVGITFKSLPPWDNHIKWAREVNRRHMVLPLDTEPWGRREPKPFLLSILCVPKAQIEQLPVYTSLIACRICCSHSIRTCIISNANSKDCLWSAVIVSQVLHIYASVTSPIIWFHS